MAKSTEINMVEGPIFPSLFRVALPLIISNVLQLLFNAADIVVVGRFSGSGALAAVGATTQLINLLANFFMGVSVGANVTTAHCAGAGDDVGIRETVHTSMMIALVCGIGMVFVGVLSASPLLTMMGTPEDIIDQSILYMRLYFLGMPAFTLYNFGAAIMRAFGDTKRPLFYLSTAGVLNVVLNVIFVAVFKMGVAGVAIVTVVSQYLSAILIIRHLITTDEKFRLVIKELRIYKNRFKQIMSIGLASGIQVAAFNVANVLIQSSINSFGSIVVAGNSAGNSIEGFVYTAMYAVAQTSMSFTGQNLGAKKYNRIDKIIACSIAFAAVIGIILGGGSYLFGTTLVGVYNSDPDVIASGVYKLSIEGMTYFLCGVMDVFGFALRGLGYSTMTMIVSLTGACAFRILWILIVFSAYPTLFTIYISYPISWVLTASMHFICYTRIRKKFPKTAE